MSGKITVIFRYVGPNGRHTEVYVNDELVKGYFFTNTSIALLMWIACDMSGRDIKEELMNADESLVPESDIILESMDDRSLLSKYDVLFNRYACANAYVYMRNLKVSNPVGFIMSVHNRFLRDLTIKYGIKDIEVRYELEEDEIFESSRFQ